MSQNRDKSRFASVIKESDFYAPGEPVEPFDFWQHVEKLCAGVPDEDEELTLQPDVPKSDDKSS